MDVLLVNKTMADNEVQELLGVTYLPTDFIWDEDSDKRKEAINNAIKFFDETFIPENFRIEEQSSNIYEVYENGETEFIYFIIIMDEEDFQELASLGE